MALAHVTVRCQPGVCVLHEPVWLRVQRDPHSFPLSLASLALAPGPVTCPLPGTMRQCSGYARLLSQVLGRFLLVQDSDTGHPLASWPPRQDSRTGLPGSPVGTDNCFHLLLHLPILLSWMNVRASWGIGEEEVGGTISKLG